MKMLSFPESWSLFLTSEDIEYTNCGADINESTGGYEIVLSASLFSST